MTTRIAQTLGFFLFLLACTSQGMAQETSGGFSEGSVLVGYDSRDCTSSLEGSIRYNSSTTCAEVCNGSAWICPSKCVAPSSCPNVGDVCSDDSLFAGFVFYTTSSCEALFVTDDNQGTTVKWKTSTGTDDISPDDFDDGRENATNRGGTLTDFPAFDLCESNTYHSNSDWYLPSRAELNLLWRNKAAIDANANGTFVAGEYWSSTEAGAFGSWVHTLGNGGQVTMFKDWERAVRCVRRD